MDGDALRRARTDADRLIREIADEAGISKSYLNKLELGHSEYMSRRAFRRLAAALGVEEPESLLAEGTSEPEGQATSPADVDVPAVPDGERPDTRERAEDLPELRDTEAVIGGGS